MRDVGRVIDGNEKDSDTYLVEWESPCYRIDGEGTIPPREHEKAHLRLNPLLPDPPADIVPIEDGMKKITNPDFDPEREYIGRDKRDEWQIVGLLGQIPITKGQPVPSDWRYMRDVSDAVKMYYVANSSVVLP